MQATKAKSIVFGAALLGLSGCQNMNQLGLDAWLGTSPSDKGELAADAPQPENVLDIGERIDTFAIDDNTHVVGEVRMVKARHEDTLLDIARHFDVGYDEIVAANPTVDIWLPRAGTAVVVPSKYILPEAPRSGIVLNLAALRLFYYPPAKKGQPRRVITHPIGIGREGWRTPQGTTNIVAKVKNPVWNVPASIRAEHARDGDPLPAVVKPGPNNPLGKFAFRLGFQSYLIHGTNRPAGIGMRVSHGCIQLFPEDIQALFPKVPVGTRVRIVNQPYLAAWQDGELYLESHTPLEEDQRAWGKSLKPMQRVLKAAVRKRKLNDAVIDWDKANALAGESRGMPVPVSQNSAGLDDILSTAPILRMPPLDTEERSVTVADASDASTKTQWFVQAGSFKYATNARRLAQMIGHLGPPIPARHIDGGEYHQVLAGPFQNRKQAEAGAKRIRSSFGTDAIILPPGI